MENVLEDFNIYNPGSLPRETLLEEFTGRRELLEDLLECIRQNRPGEPQQHLLLVGPRGMGKSTTLYAAAYKVEDDPELRREWLPLVFSEENYGIGDLADFWLEAIRVLEGALGLFGDLAEKLLEQNPDDLADLAREEFLRLLEPAGRRVIFLLDNINEIFSAINDEAELHALRAFMMEDPRVMVIGSAASYFSDVTNLENPFYDFFRVFFLERFDQPEMERALRTMAERRKDKVVLNVLETRPERVHSLRIFTGGNPRLVKMVYRLLHEGAFGDVRQDLQRLLDECTPYFKHRIEGLTVPARRVFDAIARQWDPIPVKHLTVTLRKKSNYVSAQIKRLVSEGFVEEAG
ncbi:MAG: AAA family ATPase, partial [Desulfobacterales bacterium]|nr:AAA family ATPase [Desulfobacterales bacterium]